LGGVVDFTSSIKDFKKTGEPVMKVWWESKTIWLNLMGLVAAILQAKYGFILEPAIQGAILTTLNLFFRSITNRPISLK